MEGRGEGPSSSRLTNSNLDYNGQTLLFAAKQGDVSLLQQILDNTPSTQIPELINAKDEDEYTCLHWASLKGKADIAQLLIRYGANLNARDDEGNTPLHIATKFGQLDVVLELIAAVQSPSTAVPSTSSSTPSFRSNSNITQINLQNEDGMTPLMFAASMNQTEILQILLAHGAAIDEVDNKGRTALIHACRSGHNEIVNILLMSGANVQIKDAKGRGALEVATEAEEEDIVNLLLDAVSNRLKDLTSQRDENDRQIQRAQSDLQMLTLKQHPAEDWEI
jgi:ankyrin repeat protein